MTMASRGFLGLGAHGFHHVAYTEWGAEAAAAEPRRVVCVHGLTRNGRDFDVLAAALAGDSRVACPDMVGRGKSDWLPTAEAYGYPQYLADMTALIARLGIAHVDWVGTSMGGLIGMMMAAQPKSPIRRLVVNDVGPMIPKAALDRIGAYAGTDPHFGTIAQVEAHIRERYAPFGALSDAQWRHMAETSVRAVDDGYALACDPAIGAPFLEKPLEDFEMWAVWDAIRCPVLVLRGGDSDLLTAETARAMTERGPGATVHEFAGIGHAPALMAEAQVTLVRDWLRAGD